MLIERFHSLKLLFAALSTCLLLGIRIASGASISFTPAGTQLDTDVVLDIATSIGASIEFEVRLDTNGLPGRLTEFTYDAFWDASELTLTSISFDPGMFGGADASMNFIDPFSGRPTERITYSDLPVNQNDVLTTFRFDVGPSLTNDGTLDFGVDIVVAKSVVDVRFNFERTNQDVEVQPVPEPSTLVLFVVGIIGILGIGNRCRKKAA